MRVRGGLTAAVICAVLATGCSSTQSDDPSAEDTAGKTSGYPVSVTDCGGGETTFTQAPQKIVTSNGSSLELLLRLGAGDQVIGTGFPPGEGTLPPELAEQAQGVEVLGKRVIPKEALLASGADVYIDTFASMENMGGSGMGGPTEAEFEAAGIKHIFLKSTACAPMREEAVTDLSAIEEDILALGSVTGHRDRARELVAGMRETVSAVTEAVGDVPESERPAYFFFDYDAGTRQPMAVCNRQVAHAVITLAGARNVFADCDDAFRQVTWEEVVAADPDWIQLGVRDRGSPEANEKAFDEAREWLESNPATRGVTAVKKQQYLRIVSQDTTIAGVENAETVRRIARKIHPDEFAGS